MTASGATASEGLFSGASTPRVGDAAVAIATASHKRITSDTFKRGDGQRYSFQRGVSPRVSDAAVSIATASHKAEVRYRDCDHKTISEQGRCVAALKLYGGEQPGISLPKPTILLALKLWDNRNGQELCNMNFDESVFTASMLHVSNDVFHSNSTR